MIHSFPCKNNGDYLVHIKRGPENICIRIESDSEKQNSDEFCKQKSIEDGDVEPEVYCVILPELIASNKTVGEIAPHRRLRVKCVAQGHQAVAQDDTEAAEALLCMSKSKVQKRKR
eukprot:TRINITY_DN2558_c0_g1_i2.p4 TRINITY_DN2558_c0_g1~~TRINITY_DN2558_c0_g1_i2.p4  ORF type:complete len:116 (+),score=14.31 TRINITY_DN2558_c0_g1_i2:174-521(+)